MEIHKGEIEFVDRTRNPDYEISFTSIDIAAGPISGLPERRIDPTNFTAGVRIAGGTVKVAGVTKPLAEPLDLELTAEVDDVELEKFSAYLPYGGRLDLQKTMIDGQARYVLAHRDGKLAQHGIDATLQIGGIGLATTQGYQQVMQLAGVEARDIHVDFLQNQAQIGALSLEEPCLLIQRDATGFNFEEFLPESENADVKKPPQNESNGAPMALVVQRAEAQGGTIDFIDQTVNPNANTRLHSLDIVAEKMTVWPNFAGGAMNAEGQTGKGSLSVSGAIHNQPLKGEFSIVGNELPFTPYRGYLNQLFSAARSSGNLLNGKVKLVFAPAKGGEMVTSISGRLEGHQMALRFGGQENPFLTTQQLGVGVKTLRLGLNPRVDIEEINFHGANLDVLRDQDGNINLRRLWASDSGKSPDSEAEVAKQGGAETTVAIRTIKVEKSAIEIVDQGVSPNYTTKVSQVSGKISNIVSSVERAELTLEGMLGDSAALKVSGWFTPFTEKPYLHLEGTVRRYELPPLNPYATEYVSHRIRQGDITTEVSYTIHGDKIRATAEIVLRDVRVGEKTGDEFVKRVGIPLDLAIALLQDIQGVVRLQLAMNGDGGPELNVGALIWDAVRNAVIRAITAPFRLVGRILTLGGRIGSIRIDPIRFQPGTREVESQSVK